MATNNAAPRHLNVFATICEPDQGIASPMTIAVDTSLDEGAGVLRLEGRDIGTIYGLTLPFANRHDLAGLVRALDAQITAEDDVLQEIRDALSRLIAWL